MINPTEEVKVVSVDTLLKIDEVAYNKQTSDGQTRIWGKVFNAKTNQVEYYYLSRLPGEPIGGVADRHVHPAEPLAVRLTLAGRF